MPERRKRRTSPVLQALLAERQGQLPPRSSGLNVAGKLALALAQRRIERKGKEAEEAEKAEKDARTLADAQRIITSLPDEDVFPEDIQGSRVEGPPQSVPGILEQTLMGIQDPATAAKQSDFIVQRQIAQQFAQPEKEETGGPLVTLQNVADPTKLLEFRRDDPTVDKLIESGQFIRAPVRQLTGEKLGDLTIAQKEKRRTEERQGKLALIELGTALTSVNRLPGSTGIRGALGSMFGGVLGQIDDDLGNSVTDFIAGTSTAELGEVRTQAQALVGRLLPIVTGDTSGRYTDREATIVRQVQGQLDIAKNKIQVRAALRTLINMELRRDLIDRITRDEPPSFDLFSDEGMNEFGDALQNFGFTEEEAARTIMEHRATLTNPIITR